MDVANASIKSLPNERSTPVLYVLYIPELTRKTLIARGVLVRQVDDPEMGPVQVAAGRDSQLGTTALPSD